MSVLKKRRDMPVDEVCEDSFYANLLFGLPQTLASLGVEHTKIRRNSPRTARELLHWEQINRAKLPEDLREFYSACDGLMFSWTVLDPDQDNNKTISGKMQIHSLEQLVPMSGDERTETIILDEHGFRLGLSSKMFVLEQVDSNGNVVLLYKTIRLPPTIWFCNRSFKLYFLANDFTTYMRMAIAHLGILQWQMAYVGLTTSETSSELFRLYLPHFYMGTNEVLSTEEDEGLNTVDSACMLNMKVSYLDINKEDFCILSAAPTRKFNKINSPKSKSKNQQHKMRTYIK